MDKFIESEPVKSFAAKNMVSIDFDCPLYENVDRLGKGCYKHFVLTHLRFVNSIPILVICLKSANQLQGTHQLDDAELDIPLMHLLFFSASSSRLRTTLFKRFILRCTKEDWAIPFEQLCQTICYVFQARFFLNQRKR